MKKYGHFSRFTVPVGLSACFCTASAQADTFGPAVNLQPKYKVEAVSFHCNDETWYDLGDFGRGPGRHQHPARPPRSREFTN